MKDNPEVALPWIAVLGPMNTITGGTDLLSVLKHKLEPDYPETIVNIKSIEGLDYIEADEDGLRIGAAAKLCAIVGSGPAGLTAAFYLRSRGHSVLVYDKMEEAGGLLRYAIPEYRLPKKIVRKLIAALEHMGIEFSTRVEIGKDIPVSDLVEQYNSVFLNTGAWKRPLIGLDGEELTTFGLDFLIEVNKWMESKIGKDIIVVGGGNVAVDVAITAKHPLGGMITFDSSCTGHSHAARLQGAYIPPCRPLPLQIS